MGGERESAGDSFYDTGGWGVQAKCGGGRVGKDIGIGAAVELEGEETRGGGGAGGVDGGVGDGGFKSVGGDG